MRIETFGSWDDASVTVELNLKEAVALFYSIFPSKGEKLLRSSTIDGQDVPESWAIAPGYVEATAEAIESALEGVLLDAKRLMVTPEEK